MFRFIVVTVSMLLCCALTEVVQADGPGDSPNVLVIMVDDLGYGDLSSYGAQDLKSPHIDALVSAGMRFDFAYANCPVCSPSRASLFTGCYPELVGVPGVVRTHKENNWGYLSQEATLIPDLLKPKGYKTALIGKWHLGLEPENHPIERGFDFFHGFLGDMMDDYYTHQRHGNDYMNRNKKLIHPKGHATDLFTDWTCDYLEQQKNGDQPFFLALTYNAPHTPIQPPTEWLDKVKQRESGIDEKRAKLVALIEHMDHGIGKVIGTLKQTGLYDNTLIIFTSDNGGQLNAGANNGALRDGKQSVYEGGIRVPTCVVWKGQIAAGSKSDVRTATMDWLPTICEAAGVDEPGKVDGVSLFGILKGTEKQLKPRDLFFHRREGGTRYGGLTINAMIRGQWKLLQNSPFEPQRLYDLSSDPLEKEDLRKKNVRKFNELAAALRKHVQRGGQIPWQKQEKN